MTTLSQHPGPPVAGWVEPDLVAARERAWLAPYATRSADTAGRRHAECERPGAGPYAIDRDRILRSAAYRRLSAKTQVFTGEHGDYHRTRLTHTLEVTAVARTLGRALRLNEDLIESLAQAHDLGHPPFGHAGEATLDRLLADQGGFCHNRHALVLVEELEQFNPAFPGLNLTAEVLAGQATRIRSGPNSPASLEVQVVEAADSIAYDAHDADDAVELGLLELDELLALDLWGQAARRVRRHYAALTPGELRRAVLGDLVERQLDDLVTQFYRQADVASIPSAAAAATAGLRVAFSPAWAGEKLACEQFLFDRVYRHPQVLRMRERAQGQLAGLFACLAACPDLMPARYRGRVAQVGLERAVGEYLAGMTDRYVNDRHRVWCEGAKEPARLPPSEPS